ncbi:MAG TPA: SDR family NAD(P)-dependent oxidoreductase [Rugosimonospora sp.]|nr:SDR family NAD(P)-dependent oxidoreductase [Rugosimonospora sp.]
MRLAGSTALVTGASSGLGRATAGLLAGRGVRVLAHGRDAAALAALAERTGSVPLVADLAEPGAGQRLAERALEVAGHVDLLVANAGTGYAGPFAGMPADAVAPLVAANLTACLELTRALLPGMLARGAGGLAYVTSIAGRTGVAGEAVYAATKAGLDAFAESLRLELVGSGVWVGVLVPGVVDTPFFERRGRPYQRTTPRPLPVERVAAALVRLVETGGAEAYRPRWLRLPVAVRGVAPGAYRRLAARFGRD